MEISLNRDEKIRLYLKVFIPIPELCNKIIKIKNDSDFEKTLEITGLRHIAKINILGIDPAPIATPAEEIKGILLAEYLKPRRIIEWNY